MPSVALVGPDGAGKSTISAMLRANPPVRLKCLYMGIDMKSSRIALPTSRLAEAVKARRRRPGSRGRIWSLARFLNRVADEWYRQLVSWFYQLRGYTVLYDRHFLYDFANFGPKSPARPALTVRIHRRLLQLLYPRPNLVLYLDAPAEVLYARKGEGTIAELEWRRQAFLSMVRDDPRFVRIDATRPLVDVCRNVTDQLLLLERRTGSVHREAPRVTNPDVSPHSQS